MHIIFTTAAVRWKKQTAFMRIGTVGSVLLLLLLAICTFASGERTKAQQV